MSNLLIAGISVLIRIFLNPLANVYQKKLTLSGNHPLMVSFITYLFLAFFSLLMALQVSWRSLPPAFWEYSLFVAFLGTLGNWFFVKALHAGDLSVLGPLNAYKSVIGIVVGIFVLGEFPNFFGYMGIVLISYGSFFVVGSSKEKFSMKLFKREDIQYRVWGMVVGAIEAVFLKKVIEYSSSSIAFISYCVFGALFTFLIILLNNYRILLVRREQVSIDFKGFLAVASCIGIVQFTTNYAYELMPVGYALSLFQLSALASIILGYRIFNEQEIKRKLIGAVIMIVGAVVIIFKGGGLP